MLRTTVIRSLATPTISRTPVLYSARNYTTFRETIDSLNKNLGKAAAQGIDEVEHFAHKVEDLAHKATDTTGVTKEQFEGQWEGASTSQAKDKWQEATKDVQDQWGKARDEIENEWQGAEKDMDDANVNAELNDKAETIKNDLKEKADDAKAQWNIGV